MARETNNVVKSQEFIKRSYRGFNKEALLDDARLINWNYIGPSTDDEKELNNRVKDLETKIRNLIDRHAPVKVFRNNLSKTNWLTEELKDQIKARNDLRRKLELYGGDSQKWNEWKRIRNKLNKDLKAAKNNYLKKKISHKMDN